MCLIVFGWDVHPKYKLILAANRDEFYDRPTATADFWEDHPEVLGGRDLQAGGSWMTVSKKGRISTVTNYRDLSNINPEAASRGALPVDFLLTNDTPLEYLQSVHPLADQYNGFNLLVGNPQEMLHYSNYERKVNPIKIGVHGLSNALLNTPWPKVIRAKAKFEEVIAGAFDHEDLIALMADSALAPDEQLPDTGIPKDKERALSAMCIRMEGYGTCCSTVITIDRNDRVVFTEKSYSVGDRKEETVRYSFDIEK